MNKDLIFYFYTKNLILFPSNRSISQSNMRVVASYGGKYDYLIDRGYFKRVYFQKLFFQLMKLKF